MWGRVGHHLSNKFKYLRDFGFWKKWPKKSGSLSEADFKLCRLKHGPIILSLAC